MKLHQNKLGANTVGKEKKRKESRQKEAGVEVACRGHLCQGEIQKGKKPRNKNKNKPGQPHIICVGQERQPYTYINGARQAQIGRQSKDKDNRIK